MHQPTVFKDIGSNLFREVIGIDFRRNTDALWVRFSSATDMCCLLEYILPPLNLTEIFLLAEILPRETLNKPSNSPANPHGYVADLKNPTLVQSFPSAVHPRICEFQGAFGRLKLLDTNKNRTLRQKLTGPSGSFFLDAAPISFGKEWTAYLMAVYNLAAGFLLGKSNALSPDMERILQQGCFAKSNFKSH